MLIQDITPVKRVNHPAVLIPVKWQEQVASELSEQVLITELYQRGISTDYIFGAYYALEQHGYHNDDQTFGSSEEGLHGK